MKAWTFGARKVPNLVLTNSTIGKFYHRTKYMYMYISEY